MTANPPTHTLPSQLLDLERLVSLGGRHFETRVETVVKAAGHELPVYSIALGNPAPGLPAVGFFGGVHGLERIGCEVVIAYLKSLVRRLDWDRQLHRKLESLRMVFMPIVNPGGLLLGTRANPAGVDLMRNAPVEARGRVPFLIGGQRRSASLPWFRGLEGAPMEPEALALCDVVARELLPRRFGIALDCHSGFGVRDRIWFPFAYTNQPIDSLADVYALSRLFTETYANHRYLFEPQCRQYRAHGDLWDFLYLKSGEKNAGEDRKVFLPLTLEMGSWLWVKKNPRQLFSRLGLFNPLIEHRLQRVLRRHVGWMEFLSRAACSYENWLPQGNIRERWAAQARGEWYEETGT